MGKIVDETGHTYGYLTVIERGPNTAQGRATWKCICKCGNECYVEGTQLRSGKTRSCGCYQKERTSETSRLNLIGQTIGNFTVLKSADIKKSGGHTWQCRCNLCGNENVFIITNNLNKQESCGCLTASRGTRKIQSILEENKIFYIAEKRFNDLRFEDSNHYARFDFYLPDYNCLIEYDGRQHYIQGKGNYDNEEKFIKTQEHDKIKNDYALNNNIILIRIPYTHYDNITLQDLLPNTSAFVINPF